jgi:hypothetical protein
MACPGPDSCLFAEAHTRWINGDLQGFLALFDEAIEWHVNLDGINLPYAASAVGIEDLRWRLQHMIEIFEVKSFRLAEIEHGPDSCRSKVDLRYLHRATSEMLDVSVRFTGWQANGLLVRFDERADAAYVHAYDRFVRFLMETAQRTT